MKKGINGWTFPADQPIADAARTAAGAGFEAFEPAITDDGVLRADGDEATFRAAGDAIRDAGLDVTALACGAFWTCNYASPAPADRQRAADLTLALLDRAAWCGAPAILVVPAAVGRWNEATPRTRYADALALAAAALHRLAPEAEARGVCIAVENVWNRFLLSPIEMREFIDRVNSPWVGVYFDVGNVMPFGYPQDWIETLGRRIVRVHAKDYRIEVGGPSGFCPLGEGAVDWSAVVAALLAVGYAGPLTFEGPGEIADIADRLRRIVGEKC